MTRQECLDLLHEYTKTESLRTHALAVEAAMRAYARSFGEDEETWGAVGLLHDFDYEQNQQVPDHPMKGSEVLKERGFPEELRRVILSHVPAMNVPRDSKMAQTLFACDELCGFIVAVAVIRPNKIADLEVSSVKKKLAKVGWPERSAGTSLPSRRMLTRPQMRTAGLPPSSCVGSSKAMLNTL